MRLLIFCLTLFTFILFFPGCSDDNPVTPSVTAINANGSLTQIDRTHMQGTMFVTDQNNAPITGITNSNVSVVLNWVTDGSVNGTVSVTSGSTSGKKIAAAITMDYSGSMGPDQIVCMENGVKTYINAMQSADISEIIKFDNAVIIAQPFTSDKSLLIRAVDSVFNLGNGTALYQSIYQATNDASGQNSAQYIRCVIAFTDGGENASSISRNDMITNALTLGIPIYTIGLLDFYSGTTGDPGKDMKNIADTTGGFYFRIPPDTCSGLSDIYNTINGQLNGAYSLAVTWPSTGLPPSGTTVTAIVTVNYESLSASFQKVYVIQ
ncbi:MAG: VWA domain-containing protein [Ignavibacteria bacterium]|nr:VWA domain-containing protein [Ignavibacteria bacterium]